MISQSLKKHINKLQQKKYRKEFGEFIVEGKKGIEEALKNESEIIFIIIEGNKREEFQDIIQKAEKKNIDIEYCTNKDLNFIKTTTTFPGIMGIVQISDYSLDDLINKSPIICLDRVNDPGNLGTVIRTADWFGIKNIVLSEGSVDPFMDKVVRSSMGSIFRENIFLSKNIVQTISNLKKKNYKIVSLDLNGKNLEILKPTPKTVYIFGSESHGLSEELEELTDETYTISGAGETESLNLAISVGILLNKIF